MLRPKWSPLPSLAAKRLKFDFRFDPDGFVAQLGVKMAESFFLFGQNIRK